MYQKYIYHQRIAWVCKFSLSSSLMLITNSKTDQAMKITLFGRDIVRKQTLELILKTAHWVEEHIKTSYLLRICLLIHCTPSYPISVHKLSRYSSNLSSFIVFCGI